MAASRTKVADKPFSFDGIAVGEAEELPKSMRALQPNPLAQAVADALDAPVRYLQVPNGERAKEAESYLRRAGNDSDWTVMVRYADQEDKPLATKDAHVSTTPVFVYFQVKSERSGRAYTKRRYTDKDVKSWAVANDYLEDEDGKLTPEMRAAYREANGYNTRDRKAK